MNPPSEPWRGPCLRARRKVIGRLPSAAVMSLVMGMALALEAQAARPHAPEIPVAATTLATAHGGAAALEGLGGMLHNPATLKWRGGGQAEVGFIGLSEGLSPYGLVGYQNPEGAAGAVGGFSYAGDGYDYQGVVGGFSWPLGDDFSVGFGVTGAFAKGGFGADGHVGAWARLSETAAAGLWMRNATASGVGEIPDGLSTSRVIGLGFGTVHEEIALWRIHLYETGLHYDFSTEELSPQGWRHAVSGQVWLPPGGVLGLLFGLSLDGYHPLPEPTYGVGLHLPFGGGALRLTYALSPPVEKSQNALAIQHSLSMRYEVGRQVDVLAPRVQAEALPARVAVDSVAERGLFFKLSAEDPDGQPATWELRLMRTDSSGRLGETVRLFAGKELPPRLIRWDGADTRGEPLPAGLYAFRFMATDRAGHASSAPLGLVELVARP